MYNVETLRREIERYFNILNLQLGLFLFTVAMACITMSNPCKAAAVSLIMVLPLFGWAVKNHFPPTIETLRVLCQEHPSDTELAELLALTERNHFGFMHVAFNTLVFWVGFIFYAVVLVFPEFSTWVKS